MPSKEAMRRLALRRMVEAWRGLEALGLPRESAIFLGFPHRGLFQLFTAHHYLPYESPYTGLRAAIYPRVYRPGLPSSPIRERLWRLPWWSFLRS